MSIYNSKSGIFEPSLKAQSEMQSCKLNESKSRPNITLKKIGQELDEAETKCSTLKSKLNYVIGVCQKVKSEIKGNKGKSEISLKSIRSTCENPNLKFSIKHNDYNSEIMATNKIPNYNLQRMYNIEHKTEGFDTLCLNSISTQSSPRGIVGNDDIIEESENMKEQKQNGLSNVTIIPKIQLDKFPAVMTTMPVQNETLKAIREDSQFYLPEYMQEDLQSLSIENSVEELTSEANDYFHELIPSNSEKKDFRDAELNIPDTAKIRRVDKSKQASRMEKNESNSIYNKIGDTLSKMRKKKVRIRSSISKSTVATKDTNLIGRKEAKKRKHRGRGVIQQSNLLKNPKKSIDVLEIFHNTTMKSSNSGISSKHSKFGKQTKYVKRHSSETANQKIQETLYSDERATDECQFNNKENNQDNQCSQSASYQCNSGATPEKIQEYNKSEKNSKDFYSSAQYKTHQSEHNAFNRCNDPMFIPSYEMSTLASRLKRSNKSYFNTYNFRNIPFVVGTSVTPSHNLGLNIQQVLSVMKTKQPIMNDMSPFFIQKVNRGMKSMSILLEQRNSHSKRLAFNISSHLTGTFNNNENSNINENKKSSVFDLQHMDFARTSNISENAKIIPEKDNNITTQFNKEKIDSYDYKKIKQQSSIVVNKSNTLENIKNQQKVLKVSSNKETNIGDYKMRTITDAHNVKDIRDILSTLHDQFEEINTKYEKLQSKMEKSKDKSLAKELSAMEKELNIKEEEINAIIGLYKEVMSLKQQMKMLHEKNSLVCITTESDKGCHKNPFSISILPGKSHSMNPTQISGRQKFNTMREPPSSIQLVTLLRQIQTFHKQMQLVL
ncbi:hypothetical protein ACFW04_010844 [Cataglyphis niger]